MTGKQLTASPSRSTPRLTPPLLPRFGRDDEAFLAVYAEKAAHSVSILAQSIRDAHNRNWTSKNRTLQQHKSKSCTPEAQCEGGRE